jgi:hypothetical protein
MLSRYVLRLVLQTDPSHVTGARNATLVGTTTSAADLISGVAGFQVEIHGALDTMYSVAVQATQPSSPDATALLSPVAVVLLAGCATGLGVEMQTDGSTRCQPCPAATFNVRGDGVCRACPTGAICATPTQVRPGRGFWRDPSVSEADLSSAFHACFPADHCCPNAGLTAEDTRERKAAPGCDSSAPCAPRRVGILCGGCAEGYVVVGSDCQRCSGNGGLVFLGVLLLFGFALWLTLSVPAPVDLISVVLFFAQNVPFAAPGNELLAHMNVLNLDIAQLSAAGGGGSNSDTGICALPLSPLQSVYAPMVAVLLLTGLLIGLAFLAAVWTTRKVGAPRLVIKLYRGRSARQVFVHAGLKLHAFAFTSLNTAAFRLVSCRTIGSASVLAAAPSVRCWEGEHTFWGVIASLAIAFSLASLGAVAWVASRVGQDSELVAALEKAGNHAGLVALNQDELQKLPCYELGELWMSFGLGTLVT